MRTYWKESLSIGKAVGIALLIGLALYGLFWWISGFDTAETKTFLDKPIKELSVGEFILIIGLISLFFRK